jgi:predicted ATPase/DNA-binding SARP family transcriptional activator
VKVRVLGPLDLVDDAGRPVDLAGRKQRALLAILALDVTHVVTVDRLIDDLWGDDSATDVGNALQNQVSRLRRVIGRAALVSRGLGYALDISPDDVDAVCFERLAREGRAQLRLGHVDVASRTLGEALELWRGVALNEFIDDDWARRAATRLEQLRLDVLEDRFDADLSIGRHHDIVSDLERAVADEPYRERLWGQLMIGLYRCGRQTEALAAFRRARDVLADGHGLEPGPELRALERDVLNQDPRLDWVAAPAVVAATKAATHGVVTNLPASLTTFIGREEELRAVSKAVAEYRLVTLTGTAGSGKTRLAIECGRNLLDAFEDGVWVVELAAITVASGVSAAIASALGSGAASFHDIGPGSEMSVESRLQNHLASRQLLLTLDNCEHLLPGVAEWAADALLASSGLHVLATSREPLGIGGEVQLPVPPLEVPDRAVHDPAELASCEAVRLFTDRASRVGAFQMTPDLAVRVADVCRHLDGLPLAIELAAARTKALPVSVISDALADRFDLLVSTSRTGPARQRTLRAAIDWSYQLLEDEEQRIFQLGSVFDGGFSLDAVEDLATGVGIDAERTMDLLVGLVDKSLVVPAWVGSGGARYELLETLREYGREQLAQLMRLDDAQRAHRAHFVDFVEKAEAGLISRDHQAWYRRLEQEYANLAAAFGSAMKSGAFDDAIRISTALWWFWSTTNRHDVGRTWLGSAVDAAGPNLDAPLAARALTTLCYLAGQQLDFDTAIPAGEQAVDLAAGYGDQWATAWAQHSLALTLMAAGERARSAALLAEARAVWDAVDDHWRVISADIVSCAGALVADEIDVVDVTSAEILRRASAFGYGPYQYWGHLLRSTVADRQGNVHVAAAEADRALAIAWQLDLRHFAAFALSVRGRVALRDGDDATSSAALHEAIAIAEESGADWFVAFARVGLAETARRSGDGRTAEGLLRSVVEWGMRPGSAHESGVLFRVIGGDPVELATNLAP